MAQLLEKSQLTPEPLSRVKCVQPTITARDILSKEYQEPTWIVPGLIPEGLTILASRPKTGKSWLCLGMALGVATGSKVLGQIEVQPRKVLYIALEDTDRRLQARLKMILQGDSASDQLHLAFAWPHLDGTCLQELRNWIKEHPETGLVIIDTLGKVRGSRRPAAMYDGDYAEIAGLKAIADENRIGIIVVHHLRKTTAKDVFDMVSGSTGLTGAADNVAILMRERFQADATLHVSGREVEDQELALRFEAENGSWVILGEAEQFRLTREREEIVELLRNEGEAMKLQAIAGALDKKKPNVSNLLNSLIDQRLVEKAGHGKYQLKAAQDELGERSESGEPGPKIDQPGEGSNPSELNELGELAPDRPQFQMDTSSGTEMNPVNI